MGGNRWVCPELGLVITADGDDLVVESNGKKYRARSKKATVAPIAAEPAEVPYRHPTGGEIMLPAGWQVTQSQLGLQLVPPDTAYTPQGPAEIYTLAAQPVPGIAKIEDPRILMYVDRMLRGLLPTLGAPSAPVACGPGILLRWSGQNAMTGAEILALACLQLAGDSVVGVIGLGERARVEARQPLLERVFRSWKRGAGTRDPALVGTWQHWSYSGGQHASHESRRVVLLAADGNVVERVAHENISNVHAAFSNDGRRGTWTAGEHMLFITWSDGSQVSWQYQVQGNPGQRRMWLVTAGQSQPMEWNEAN